MSLPIATTTITLLRSGGSSSWDTPDDVDYEDGVNYEEVDGKPIRAVISLRGGSASSAPEGSSVNYSYSLVADPCELSEDMMIKDNTTGDIFQVDAIGFVNMPPISHVTAVLSKSVASH